MKIVKRILWVVLGLIVLLAVIGLFVDGDFSVKREVVIEKPKTEVFEFVKYLENQDKYAVWSNIDPNMKKEYRGTDGTVGFVSAWESDNEEVGKGEQEITNIVEGEKLDYELRFLEPFESVGYASMTTESAGQSQTLVAWEFYGKMDYPTNLFLLFMDMEKELGANLQDGLDNLKGILEEK